MQRFNLVLWLFLVPLVLYQSPVYSENSNEALAESIMTNDQLDVIIHRLDEQATGGEGFWEFRLADVPVTVITDEESDRMRVIIPIISVDEIDNEQLYRLMQANFDSALDARYAIAKDILWSAYIHPLSVLSDEEFLSGLGQTLNLVTNFGGTYSSGLLLFGGGDSKSIQDRQLIQELIEKGSAI